MNLEANTELSIIIPSFNARKTLGKTLDSIRNQKLNINLEVIIVNDCSNYDYDNLVQKYQKYFKINELKTLRNMGPGGARQYGLDHSISKYVVFIDSDDYFYQANSLANLYEKIVKEDADLVIGNFLYERDNKIIVKSRNYVWLHGKIYKREFLTKNNIRFNESRANEDNGFNRLILLLRPKVTYLDEIVYVYQENPNSITRSNNRLYKLNGLEGYCYNMNWAMDEALKRKVNEKTIFILAQNILGTLYFYYLDLEEKYDANKILIWSKHIKEKYDEYKDIGRDITINLSQIKNDLKDDISITKERISFEEFLELLN